MGKKVDVKPETHVIYPILFAICAQIATLFVLGLNGIIFSPVSCNLVPVDQEGTSSIHAGHTDYHDAHMKCTTSLDLIHLLPSTFISLCGFIFTVGPLNLLFKLREGKTSLQKMSEDYSDERMDFYAYARD